MYKYIVLINKMKAGVVYANSKADALKKAIYTYGLNCDVEEYQTN